MPFDRPFQSLHTFPGTEAHPDGKVKFWWVPDTYTRRYAMGEFGEKGGNHSIQVALSWADYDDFETFALGKTTRVLVDGSPALTRLLPLASPFRTNHYLTDLTVVRHGRWTPVPNDFISDPDASYSFDYGTEFVLAQADFSDRSFEVVNDDTAAAQGSVGAGATPELCRFVTRRPVYSYRERVISGYNLETEAGAGDDPPVQPIPVPSFVVDSQGTIEYVLHQWPIDSLPKKAWGDCAGKINNAAFDTVTPRGLNIAAQRLLLAAVSLEGKNGSPDPYLGPDGNRYVTIRYTFRWRPVGAGSEANYATWNQYPRPRGTDGTVQILPMRYRGTSGANTVRPYQTADFLKLFKPEIGS